MAIRDRPMMRTARLALAFFLAAAFAQAEKRHVEIVAADADDEAYLQIADPTFPSDAHRVKYTITDCVGLLQPDGDCNGIWIDRVDIADTESFLSAMPIVVGSAMDSLKADQRVVFAHEAWSIRIPGPELAPGLVGIYDPYYTLAVSPSDLGGATLRMAWTCKDSSGATLTGGSGNLDVPELDNKAQHDLTLKKNCMDAIYASVTAADMVAKSFQLPVRETLDSGVTWAGPYTMTYTVTDNGGNTDFTWTVTDGAGATVDTDTTAYADAIKADDVVLGLKVLGLAAVSASLTVADFPSTFTIPCGVYDWGARDGSGPLLNPPYQIVGTATVDGGDIDFAWDVKDGASTTIGSGVGTHASATEAHVASDEMLNDCRVEIEAQNVITDVTTASFDVETPELPFVPTQAPIQITGCQAITTPNRTYLITQDIVSNSGICFTFSGAQNVAIDLGGHNITWSETGVGHVAIFTSNYSHWYGGSITKGAYNPGTDANNVIIAFGRTTQTGSVAGANLRLSQLTMASHMGQSSASSHSIIGYGSGVISNSYIRLDNSRCTLSGVGKTASCVNMDGTPPAEFPNGIFLLFNDIFNNQTIGPTRNGQGFNIGVNFGSSGVDHDPVVIGVGNYCEMNDNIEEANCFFAYGGRHVLHRDSTAVLLGDFPRGFGADGNSQDVLWEYNTCIATDAGVSADCYFYRTVFGLSNNFINHEMHHNTCTCTGTGCEDCITIAASYDPVIVEAAMLIRHNTLVAGNSAESVLKIEAAGAEVNGGGIFIENHIEDAGTRDGILLQDPPVTENWQETVFQGNVLIGDFTLDWNVDEVYWCNNPDQGVTWDIVEGSGTHNHTIQAEDCWP
jgi:hypothetical protein